MIVRELIGLLELWRFGGAETSTGRFELKVSALKLRSKSWSMCCIGHAMSQSQETAEFESP